MRSNRDVQQLQRAMMLMTVQLNANADVQLHNQVAEANKTEFKYAQVRQRTFFGNSYVQNNAQYKVGHPAASVGRKMGHR